MTFTLISRLRYISFLLILLLPFPVSAGYIRYTIDEVTHWHDNNISSYAFAGNREATASADVSTSSSFDAALSVWRYNQAAADAIARYRYEVDVSIDSSKIRGDIPFIVTTASTVACDGLCLAQANIYSNLWTTQEHFVYFGPGDYAEAFYDEFSSTTRTVVQGTTQFWFSLYARAFAVAIEGQNQQVGTTPTPDIRSSSAEVWIDPTVTIDPVWASQNPDLLQFVTITEHLLPIVGTWSDSGGLPPELCAELRPCSRSLDPFHSPVPAPAALWLLCIGLFALRISYGSKT